MLLVDDDDDDDDDDYDLQEDDDKSSIFMQGTLQNFAALLRHIADPSTGRKAAALTVGCKQETRLRMPVQPREACKDCLQFACSFTSRRDNPHTHSQAKWPSFGDCWKMRRKAFGSLAKARGFGSVGALSLLRAEVPDFGRPGAFKQHGVKVLTGTFLHVEVMKVETPVTKRL